MAEESFESMRGLSESSSESEKVSTILEMLKNVKEEIEEILRNSFWGKVTLSKKTVLGMFQKLEESTVTLESVENNGTECFFNILNEVKMGFKNILNNSQNPFFRLGNEKLRVERFYLKNVALSLSIMAVLAQE